MKKSIIIEDLDIELKLHNCNYCAGKPPEKPTVDIELTFEAPREVGLKWLDWIGQTVFTYGKKHRVTVTVEDMEG